ncbi:pantetheine-phosphate adenylyltransferase [Sphingomonas crusticola]|uniref:pantetheine-phosphate adenylyltransferase n=1 Tax=Sphingomonas crusticola TaxID=1697973 RepID=UPI000E26834B|nr:pantetheine-phosphate adenylyltransferase [Sphingomonas crusticola]
MSRVAAYTGTFDPLTLGHVDIIRRAAKLTDRLVIGVSTNSLKSPLFTLEQRVAALRREVMAIQGDIEVREFAGLAVDFARSVGAQFVVRGLRSGTDLDYESPMAAMNGTMAPEVDTIFLVAAPAFAHIASSLVKDVARGGGDIEHFVPATVAADIRAHTR